MGPDANRKLRVAVVVPAKKLHCLASPVWVQRYGPLQVASAAAGAGYPVRLFNEELGPMVAAASLAREFDVVGFSCKSSALTRAEDIAGEVKAEASRTGRNVVTVLGGEHVSMEGDGEGDGEGNGEGAGSFRSRRSGHFDYFLRGEAEQAFVTLLNSLDTVRGGIGVVPPLTLEDHHTCERFDNIPDLSLCSEYMETVGGFMFRHFPLLWCISRGRAPLLTFQGSRGCPYNCSFCPSPTLLQSRVYRRRSVESAVACLREHARISGIRHVMFEDPTAALPFSSESHRFFKALADNPTGLKATLLVRADLCRDTELLRLMRAAGVTNLSVGIESLNDRTLGDFRKNISYETSREAVDIFHGLGFTITGLFIAGYDTDGPDCFDRMVEFIRETGIEKWRVTPLGQMLETGGQFMPAHRYFLWDEFRRFGRDVIDYGNGEFVLFYPRNMKPSELQGKMMEFNLAVSGVADLARHVAAKRSAASVKQRILNVIAEKMVVKGIAASGYMDMVREIEGEFYEENGPTARLREDALVKRYREKKGLQKDAGRGAGTAAGIFPAAALAD
jgi:radical SAM superfamily enzyme YgiQ (UPF0313 family)